jgi:hypothetical protein
MILLRHFTVMLAEQKDGGAPSFGGGHEVSEAEHFTPRSSRMGLNVQRANAKADDAKVSTSCES